MINLSFLINRDMPTAQISVVEIKVPLDPACGICQQQDETVAHALWSCPMARNVWALVAGKLQKRSLEAEDFYVLVRESRESIPYHIGRYGQNIPYRTKQTGMYNPPVSYRKKYRPYRPISGNTSWYKKKFFFFF